ncbi:MAG: protein kinase [Chloroflexia bacterium]|nr:protein kinase [Chloroflexia bacterium]
MIGALLNERYRLDADLGGGGMGTVYRAHDLLLDRPVAVKLVSQNRLGTEGRIRLLREAQSAAQLNHPNIVAVYDAGEADGNPFIVMELIEGESLHEHPPEQLDEIISMALQICAALEHAHGQGIIHRDIKPENVLRATGGVVKLSDFGLARSVTSRLSTEGGVTGTAFYLAPEQALGQPIDGRTDLYSFGVMLYELTTGRLPFTGDDLLSVISQHLHAPVIPPRTYNPELPPALDELIVQMLRKQPEQRPASATALKQGLQQLRVARIEPGTAVAEKFSLLDQLVRGRMVGREQEFAEAKAIWQRAAAGEGQVLLISGEPGIGKTRFVYELTTLVQVLGGWTLRGECYTEGGAPYAPLSQILRELLSDPARTGAKPDLPDMIMADLLTLAPDLRELYPQIPYNPSLDPQAEQQRLFESVFALCTALLKTNPLLLVIEDVHWADGGTLLLLRHLARRFRDLPLLIVLTYREIQIDQAQGLDELLLDLSRKHITTRIKLGRLSREQTRSLLAVMFDDEITDEFLALIYRETEGNPFFIQEVCKTLIDEGHIYREDGVWQRDNVEQIQIPQSVRLAIRSRLNRLTDEVQDVLLMAAILGREFEFAVLREACEQDEETLIEALEQAERAQLILELKRADRELFRFAHGLMPSTLRESVSGLRRHRMHRRAAQAIEAVHADDFGALAYHYSEAADVERARFYLVRAAERAAQVYSNEEAIHFYSEALDLLPPDHPERFELLAARAQVYDLVAQREAQLADVEAMLALAQEWADNARRCDALIALADFYMVTERFRSREPAEEALTLARSLQDPVREGHCLRRLGYEALFRNDFRSSRQSLQESADRFREAGLPQEAAISLNQLALPLAYLREYEAAQKVAQEAVLLSRQAGDRRQEAISLRRIAIIHLQQNEYAQALPLARQALELHRELGDRLEECNALNVLGLVQGWLGQVEESKAHLEQSLELAEIIGSDSGFSSALNNLLWLYYRWQGAYEQGLAFLEAQQDKAHIANNRFLSSRLDLHKAQFLSLFGRYEQALELAQSALAWTRQIGENLPEAAALSYIGRLWAELGDYEQAQRYAEQAVRLVSGHSRERERAIMLIDRGYVAWREGNWPNLQLGLDKVRQAIALLRGTEWLLNLAEALFTAARLHLALGQVDEAWVISSGAMRMASKWPFMLEEYLHTHFQVLQAAGRQEEADVYLQRAYERVLLVANNTEDKGLRQSWLKDVWLVREILAAIEAKGRRQIQA